MSETRHPRPGWAYPFATTAELFDGGTKLALLVQQADGTQKLHRLNIADVLASVVSYG